MKEISKSRPVERCSAMIHFWPASHHCGVETSVSDEIHLDDPLSTLISLPSSTSSALRKPLDALFLHRFESAPVPSGVLFHFDEHLEGAYQAERSLTESVKRIHTTRSGVRD